MFKRGPMTLDPNGVTFTQRYGVEGNGRTFARDGQSTFLDPKNPYLDLKS